MLEYNGKSVICFVMDCCQEKNLLLTFFLLLYVSASTTAGEVFAFVHYCTFPNKGGRPEEDPVASDLFPFLLTFLIMSVFCTHELNSVFVNIKKRFLLTWCFSKIV